MDELDSMLNVLQQPPEELTYEQAFAQLEKIVEALESNEHTLDVSLSLYERGQVLASYCAKLLNQAVLRVQQLSGDQLVDYPAEE